MKTTGIRIAKQAFQIQSDCLKDAFSHVDENEFARAVDALAGAARIGASGCGHTGIACQHFVHLMCCMERPARFIYPSEAVHGGTGFLQKGDVMLLASRGGKTSELLPILEICKTKAVTVIVMTENTGSQLAQGADIVLKLYITRETDPNSCQGTTSNTVINVLFDALQAALIEEIGFEVEGFALVHPGGAVGERLNKRQLI